MKQSNILSFLRRKKEIPSEVCDKEASASGKVKSDRQLASTPPVDSSRPSTSTGIGIEQKPPQKKKQGAFLPQWCRDIPWVLFNSERELATCVICSKNKQLSEEKWVLGFSGLYKKETFVWHSKSKMHRDSIVFDNVQNPATSTLARCVKEMDKVMFEHLTHLFIIVYFIGTNEKPFTDFPRQVTLARKLNVNIKEQYITDKYCAQFVNYIALDFQDSVIRKVKKSQYFSILIDGSTDRSGDDNAIVYARYIYEGDIREDLLGLITLKSGTAVAYYEALTELLDSTKIEWRHPNYLISLGTDGASSMVGNKSGLITLIKKDVPNCISTHCVSHRLQLAILDATSNLSYLGDFDKIVKHIFHFYRGSNKRLQSLHATASALEVEIVKLHDIHSIRWVTSKGEAMRALQKNYVAVAVNLESIASDTSSAGSAAAKGIVLKMKSFKFAKILHFLRDFYSVLDPLCKLLQSKELVLSQVKNKITVTVDNLEMYFGNEGQHVKHFLLKIEDAGDVASVFFNGLQLTHVKQGEQYQLLRKTILTNTCHYLKERLESTNNPVGLNCHILDPMQHPPDNDASFMSYGNNEIVELAKHFFLDRNISGYAETLKSEWMEFKYTTRNLGLEIQGYIKKLKEYPGRFRLLHQVVEAVACVAVSTASCERGFSFVNRIKTKQRLSLDTATLRDLLQLAVNGPPHEIYNPSAAIDRWYFTAPGKRHVGGHKRKLAVTDM